ncbi:MAG: MFS transporter [Pseudomonadota bacterium]
MEHRDAGLAPVSRVLVIVALLLVGVNLRPAITSVGLVLDGIRSSTGMSAASAGVLISLPVICFGIFSPLAPRLIRWRAPEQVIMLALLGLAAGIGGRVFFGVPGLFAGTLLVSACISVIMVLVPGIIKNEFPARAGFLMGMYSMALNAGVALGSGVSVPIQTLAGGDWRMALLFWSLPVLVAILVWMPFMRRRSPQPRQQRAPLNGLRGSVLAWQVTGYFSFQSALAFCVFGWLPTILIDRGLSPLQAGYVLSVSVLMQFVTGFGLTWMCRNKSDQRAAIVILMSLMLIGVGGCMFAPLGQVWIWASVLGLGQGGAFSIAMILMVARAPNGVVAVSLSGMVQGVGYLIAGLGPLIAGVLHDFTHGWNAAAIFFGFLALAAIAAGLGAGRNLQIDAQVERPALM